MLPDDFTHWLPGPQSVSKLQVFPVVPLGSSGSYTGCSSPDFRDFKENIGSEKAKVLKYGHFES